MEAELLKQLVTNPAHWPVFLILAVVVIFIVKFVGVLAEAAAKRIWSNAKDKKALLSFCRFAAQVVAVALVMYIANAVYWQHNIKRFMPASVDKPINTCDATVKLIIESQDERNTHFMSKGGYLAFGKGNEAILVTAAPDSWGRPVASNEYQFRGLFKMDASSTAAGKPVNILRDAEYVQVKFLEAPNDFRLIRGEAVCVLNSDVRISMEFSEQKATDQKVYLRDMTTIKETLK
ncbi:MAG: hypothetical protein WC047_00960 [Kiritimatiellales bacterium]